MIKILSVILALSLCTQAQYPEWYEGDTPKYLSESPLPKGWPKPGPYFQVVKKKYPAYRVATTEGKKLFTFPRLFKHIKEQGIPMTAPVEMDISDEEKSLKVKTMGFLYQDQKVPNASKNKKINVLDVPSETFLSYCWQGCDCEKKQQSVKEALFLHAAVMGVELYEFRLLGYNSPGVPDDNQTWEMQAKMR